MSVLVVRSSVVAHIPMTLTPDHITSPVSHHGIHFAESMGLPNETNIGPRVHQLCFPFESSPSGSFIDPNQKKDTTPKRCPSSPIIEKELISLHVVHLASPNMSQSPWIEPALQTDWGYTPMGHEVGVPVEAPHMASSYSRAGVQSTAALRAEPSCSSSPSSSLSGLDPFPVDCLCPPPPRASVTMDPQSQALLDKKLRKMGGWKSRLLNVQLSTRTDSLPRSTTRKILEFIRDDLTLRRNRSGKMSRLSSRSVATPPNESLVCDRLAK